MKYITILQARMTSTRLPAKVVLPIAGFPMSLLCAKRVISKDLDFVLATSSDPTDNILENLFKKNNIESYRGDLKNVLERFVNIINDKHYKDNDVVIRLTADNPVVDKYFLMEMKEIYEKNNLDYFSAEPEILKDVNWPKGLSAEFIRAGLLRESYYSDKTNMNIEHVTYGIRNKLDKIESFNNYKKLDKSYNNISVGVDDIRDYIRVESIFCNNEWNIHYEKLLGMSF